MFTTSGENPAVDSFDILKEMLNLLTVLVEEIGLTSRDVSTIRTRTTEEGIGFLTKTLPLLSKALDSGLGTCVFKLPSNFKRRWRDSEIPAFCGSLFSLVFEKDGHMKRDASPEAVKKLRQIGFLFYKFVLPFSDEQKNRATREFIETDAAICDFPVTSVSELARSLTTTVFGKAFDPMGLNFSHGPGIVSDGCSNAEKFESEFDPNSIVVRHFGLTRYNEVYGERESQLANHFKTISGVDSTRPVVGSKPAKVILVPKDSRGPRIISCEPSVKQFAQQGIRKWTQDRLESHPITRGKINFTDQTINRDLALKHSATKSFSTIDLAAASDRVSLACVQYLFEHVPIYLKSLLISRSSHTEIQLSSDAVQLLPLRKFAPMGSAVCFTTLAWVVYALAYAAIVLNHPGEKGISDSLYVYGDDIIVDTRFASTVIQALETHGLKVNNDKSFVNSSFLESCGMDAFKGVSVTPIRARALLSRSDRPKTSRELHLALLDHSFCSKVVKTLELANNLSKDYPQTSEYLYRLVEYVLKRKLPFGTVTSGFLCRHMPTTEVAWGLNTLESLKCTGRGEDLRALFVITHKDKYNETGFGRLRRILPMMGMECHVPAFGEIDKTRSYNLRTRKLQRWYAGAYVARLKAS